MVVCKQEIPKTLPLVAETDSPARKSCDWLSHCYYVVVLVRMFKQTEECFDKPTESLCLHFLENGNGFKILSEGEQHITQTQR